MRILDRIEQLYGIGGGPGANRVAGSREEDLAHELAGGWMEEAGLTVEVDADGNLLGRRGDARIWTGSHLDSVPNGGRFDGPLGVLAGIEAAERLPDLSLAVVAFRAEETGCHGSRARAARGDLPEHYLEAHIEQGPVLERVGAPLAVVTSIAGVARGELVFTGRTGHAGTTPMAGRDDALVSAAQAILQIRDAAKAIDGAVATVGRVEVAPGALNVIPERVTLSVDARAPDAERFAELIEALGLEPTYRVEPVALETGALRAELEARGLPIVELPSGAGHDAGILAAAGVRAGMLFVRSLNGGISHSPDELSSPEDVALCVDVLAGTLARLSRDAGGASS